jgi:hypothetical protein
MVDDLLAHHKLVGLSRTEVIALLGEDRDRSISATTILCTGWTGTRRGQH